MVFMTSLKTFSTPVGRGCITYMGGTSGPISCLFIRWCQLGAQQNRICSRWVGSLALSVVCNPRKKLHEGRLEYPQHRFLVSDRHCEQPLFALLCFVSILSRYAANILGATLWRFKTLMLWSIAFHTEPPNILASIANGVNRVGGRHAVVPNTLYVTVNFGISKACGPLIYNHSMVGRWSR